MLARWNMEEVLRRAEGGRGFLVWLSAPRKDYFFMSAQEMVRENTSGHGGLSFRWFLPTLSQGPFCIRTAGGHIDDWMNTVTNIIGWTTICTTVTQVILPSIPIWSKAFGLRSKGGYLGQEATTSPNTLTSFNGFISRNCSWDLEIWHRVATPKCSIWELLHLRNARFENCSIWELLHLRNAWFENCSIWELLNLRIAKFEKCWIWEMLDLRIAGYEKRIIWETWGWRQIIHFEKAAISIKMVKFRISR